MSESRSGDPSASRRGPRARASDAQRTAVLEALDAAFTDGRLSSFEHYERTRTATRSQFIDELRPLVADLRGADADLGLGEDSRGPGPHADPSTDPDDRGWPRPRWRRRVALVCGLAAVGLVAAMVAFVSASGGSNSDPEPPGPLHTLDGMTRMLDAAEDEFGGQAIDTLGISGNSASLMQEDPTEPGKRLIYVFRGEWQESNFDSHPAPNKFRLEDIDPAVIMAAIDAAPEHLDMDEDARTSHVSVYPDAVGDPEYVVNVSEGPGEPLGSVTVGIDGQVRKVQAP